MNGILYLVQPAELAGTYRYKMLKITVQAVGAVGVPVKFEYINDAEFTETLQFHLEMYAFICEATRGKS
tara:strand:- start:770 stop:976 length:207 start_codon:yes stop_codon:yes gene_type:complete